MFVGVGINHFLDTKWFEPIVPEILGRPIFWIYLSGIFEILLGILILSKEHRKIASLGIVLLLIILYLANLNMWINDIPIGEVKFNNLEHFARLCMQIILIFMALYIGNWPPFNKNDT
jgi:uncharacterized membrane protein|tara:strand:+ start:49 stop:402 length:354 start_codon:yes stop_codon:yes gene_type:complete